MKCLVNKCKGEVKARSLCKTHYYQWYKGNLDIEVPPAMSPAESGRIGGKNGTTGGFYANRELARIAGSRGGKISKRGPTPKQVQAAKRYEKKVMSFEPTHTRKSFLDMFKVSV